MAFIYRKLLLPALRIYLLVCLGMYIFQRSLLYLPTANEAGTPANTQVMSFGDTKIVATVRPFDSPDALIYFGGNAEDVSWSLPEFSEKFPKHALYLMHYPGYGGSSGEPSEEVLHAAALAFFDQVHSQHPNITVVGRSLGSGVAVKLAAIRPLQRLILITPFDSVENVAAHRFFFIPVSWLLKDKFESWRYAPKITAPTEIIIAGQDEMIPRENTEALVRAFKPGVATVKVIPSATHNSAEY